jgi:hypothetical protein
MELPELLDSNKYQITLVPHGVLTGLPNKGHPYQIVDSQGQEVACVWESLDFAHKEVLFNGEKCTTHICSVS